VAANKKGRAVHFNDGLYPVLGRHEQSPFRRGKTAISRSVSPGQMGGDVHVDAALELRELVAERGCYSGGKRS